ncbi:hypothetical protein BDN70DRAFT_937311 [Pholiota conissans]|uniref:Uncharacterized protein n=1 Tax=Pholiota conissans TaxID=109636 RepID=A0A9P5YPN5_9AGAR|nr:hypothetical protein BDN70DRAFT_937311 [Pholiota conissans]
MPGCICEGCNRKFSTIRFYQAHIRQTRDAVCRQFARTLPVRKSLTGNITALYQGVLKRVLSWIYSACGKDEIDARCRRLPPNHNIRLFMKCVAHLSRVTGTEYDQISLFILELIVDIRLPGNVSNARLVKAVRALLDFILLAKYPNLDIFVELGIRDEFDILKFYFIGHYRVFIELYGTMDNNTEYMERLHIDMAKDAYKKKSIL